MSVEKLAKLKGSLSHYDVSIPGTGFGLYNVYKRIELYYEIDDGLTVESEYDKGCKITLKLPIVRTPAQEQTALSEGA